MRNALACCTSETAAVGNDPTGRLDELATCWYGAAFVSMTAGPMMRLPGRKCAPSKIGVSSCR